jgi:DNA-binding response OmpR family regulator
VSLKRGHEAKKKTVMVVEDDQRLLDLYKMALESTYGYAVVTANDATGALGVFEELCEQGNSPTAVILDNKLPDGLGTLVAKKIMAIDPNVRIVIASAENVQMDNAVVLRKPFLLNALFTAISLGSGLPYARPKQ